MVKKRQDEVDPPIVAHLQIALVEPETAETRPVALLRSGDLCPICQTARLDYDGLLNLACPTCGYALGGCST
jgi:hypothetical protein